MGVIPSEEIKSRITKLQHSMIKNGLEGALILENTNLYYFTGSVFDGFLYISVEAEPLLLVKRGLDRVKKESPLKHLYSIQSAGDIALAIQEHNVLPSLLGLELDVLPARDYLRYKLQVFKGVKLVDLSKIIRELRWSKSSYEQDLIKESAEIHNQLFLEIPRLLQVGIFDWELAAQIEYRARMYGHLGITRFRGLNNELFMGDVLTGPQGTVSSPYDTPFGGQGFTPLYPRGASGSKIERNQPICIDCLGNYTGYMVDQTRTYCLGAPPAILKKAYQVALEIQSMIESLAKPGVNAAVLYEKAVGLAQKAQLGDYFMGHGEPVGFIGHGIGLEVNEWPVIARGVELALEEGQVFALEPKFVFPQLGLVGVENTYLVTANGLEKLTKTPEELEQ